MVAPTLQMGSEKLTTVSKVEQAVRALLELTF